MASRSIWSGAVSFGLVNVPVKLYSATSPKSVRFHQLSGKTGARIHQKRVDSSTNEEVAFEDIVKGYELSPDRYVTIDSDELEALLPSQSKMIGIEEFVALSEIDPTAYDKTYYVAPADPSTGTGKAYRLLAEAMQEEGKVGIGRIIVRSKEHLAVLRVRNGVLVLSTMLFGDEVLRPERVVDLDEFQGEASPAEVDMAKQLIGALTTDFDPSKFHDTYREQVLDLIQRKAAGETIEAPQAEEAAAPVPDLMAALQASKAAADAKKGGPAKTSAKKRTSAKSKAAA